MQLSKAEAEKDNVVVPTTMEEYCMKPKPRAGGVAVGGGGVDNIEMDDDFYDDCYDLDDDDEDDEEDEDDEDEEDGTDGGGGNNAAAESQGCNSIDILLVPESAPDPVLSHAWSSEAGLNF